MPPPQSRSFNQFYETDDDNDSTPTASFSPLVLSHPPALPHLIDTPPTLADCTKEAKKLFNLPDHAEISLTIQYKTSAGTKPVVLTESSWKMVLARRGGKEGALQIDVKVKESEVTLGKRKRKEVEHEEEEEAAPVKRGPPSSPFRPPRRRVNRIKTSSSPPPLGVSDPIKVRLYFRHYQLLFPREHVDCLSNLTIWEVWEDLFRARRIRSKAVQTTLS